MPGDPVRAIESEFSVALGSPERVGAMCQVLRGRIGVPVAVGSHPAKPPAEPLPEDDLQRLIPLLRRRVGAIAQPLFALLEEAARAADQPRAIVRGLLESRDPALAARALDLAIVLAEDGRFSVDLDAARLLASRVDAEGSGFAEPASLEKIARLLHLGEIGSGPHGTEPLLALYLAGPGISLRSLAARLLDRSATAVPPIRVERLLGRDAYRFLRPYLEYVGATHRDLLDLAREGPVRPLVLESFQEAEIRCGERLLRQLIAEIGWQRLNLGLEVRERVAVSWEGSFPLLVSAAEAALFDGCASARRSGRQFLAIAHGGAPADVMDADAAAAGSQDEDRIARFRMYNIAHAEVLAAILEVAPLTRARCARVLARMDRIVADFVFLFAQFDEECANLPGVYAALREKIVGGPRREWEGDDAGEEDRPLPPAIMRLAIAFEDPVSLGDVHTLHGLKRYLHQKGLRLGFRLVERGGPTNRTLDLALASPERVMHVARRIQYVDFEPEPDDAAAAGGGIPYPVALLVDGLARPLLHGMRVLPDVKVFCYGNEVHYYIAYGSHPAFLRIDYSPPLRGGMCDLEYYGVSKNELTQHPQPALDAIQRFFRRLDFDCKTARTRVAARYDKERALDLGDICEKAESLFRLLPHLMEIDWVIGSLRLDGEARARVAQAWAEFFVRWGVLPFEQFLTGDRTGIRVAVEPGPVGEREVVWSGEGPYPDIVRGSVDGATLRDHLRAALGACGFPESFATCEGIPDRSCGQIALDRALLRPLRQAVVRGEAIEGTNGIVRVSAALFQTDHEAERLAEILGGGNEEDADALLRSARIASLVARLERSLRFRTTGSVNGFEVQTASLPLGMQDARVHVLRDAGGMVRLALFATEGILYRRRRSPDAPWRPSDGGDAAEVATLLRRRGYDAAGSDVAVIPEDTRAAILRDLVRNRGRHRPARAIPGERIVVGIAASPGRAAGPVVFGTEGRAAGDLEGAILIAAAIRPEDNAHLYRASGIVSTGGGILSHAGLLALQFRKPALMIAGHWRTEEDGRRVLLYRRAEFDEVEATVAGLAVTLRRRLRERDDAILEGDLVVLDADEGTLRILGHDAEPLALHDELRQLREAGRLLARASDAAEILDLRGRRLRARHHLERLLTRMRDRALARHAVRELLIGETAAAGGRGDAARLLSILLANPEVGAEARDHTGEVVSEMIFRRRARVAAARSLIPTSDDEHEVLALRLDVVRISEALAEAGAVLLESGWRDPAGAPEPAEPAECDAAALARLRALRARAAVRCGEPDCAMPEARHLLRRIDRMDAVLPASEPLSALRERLAREDAAAVARHAGRGILTPRDGGIELAPLMGSKAANLAEVERVVGSDLVPPWFVVTDHAFRAILDAPVGVGDAMAEATTARRLIESILGRDGASDAQKAFLIRKVCEGIHLPDRIAADIIDAYRALGLAAPPGPGESAEEPLVAVRSSGSEEDVEEATRAGEFETFLFVRGERDLILHVKRVFSGFWTARAIHNRRLFGGGMDAVRGGVLVQRITRSRVSGVVQTANVAEGRMREIVVNAGLGIGEGIVSGTVGADLIVVSKEGDAGPDALLRFRYVTNDKREKVVYDARRGSGTVRIETLYHERFRPALEYTELCDLVRAARRLENAYAIPLDIEFGIEGVALRILQARPVATFAATLRETAEKWPLRPEPPEKPEEEAR